MWSRVNTSDSRIFCSVTYVIHLCVKVRVTAATTKYTRTQTHTQSFTHSFSLWLSVSVTLIGCSQGIRAWDRQQEKGGRREEVDECDVTLLFTWLVFTNRPTNTHSLRYTVCVPGPLSSVCSDYLNFVLKFNEDKSVAGGSAFNTIIPGLLHDKLSQVTVGTSHFPFKYIHVSLICIFSLCLFPPREDLWRGTRTMQRERKHGNMFQEKRDAHSSVCAVCIVTHSCLYR